MINTLLWNCNECNQIHDSDIVGFTCPNKYKYKNLTEEQKRIHKFYCSKSWLNVRSAILSRDVYCQRCLSLYNLYTVDDLEVHHIHKIYNHWDKRLDTTNLVCLCKTCHRQVDLSCKDGTLDFNFEPKPITYKIR